MIDLEEIFSLQAKLQAYLTKNDGSLASPKEMYNSATAAIVEICEMLQEDTRWKKTITKSNRPEIYNREAFIHEFADVFIYMMNVLIFSGISLDEAFDMVKNVQDKNIARLKT